MSVLSIVLLSIAGTALTLVVLAILILAFVTFSRVAALPALDSRMAGIEQYLRDISNSPDGDPTATLYRTSDGKHTAGSLEELAIKVMNDPESELNIDQKQALQQFLEQVEKQTQITQFSDDDDDDDESDIPDFPK